MIFLVNFGVRPPLLIGTAWLLAYDRVVADGRHFDTADHMLKTYLSRLLPKRDGVEAVDALAWETWARPAGK